MDTILTSLVITTYNRAALLSKALESVAHSQIDDPAQVEVIVVDNNSTDRTHNVVTEIRARGFPFTLRYVSEHQQGLSYARNRGADEATGIYIVYMDDDQLMEKSYLSRLVPAFRSTEAACLGGPIFYYNKEPLPSWLPPLLENVGQCDLGSKVKLLRQEGERLHGGNMAFVRQELLDVGKFNVSLGRNGTSLLAGEEDELQQRLHTTGRRIVYDPGLIQFHYLAPARLTKRFWRRHQLDYGRTLYRKRLSNGDEPKGAVLFGAPRWCWWQLLTKDIPAAMRPLMRLDITQAFYKELAVRARLGEIREARKQSANKTR
jgi:glycosyltransferase involved in cell wall biosynthesis